MRRSIYKADFIKLAKSHGFQASTMIRDAWFNPTLFMHISITDEEDPFIIINVHSRPLKGTEFTLQSFKTCDELDGFLTVAKVMEV